MALARYALGQAGTAGRVLEVLDYINRLHRAINCLDADFHPIPTCTRPPQVTNEFVAGWGGFYRVAANYLTVAIGHPESLSTAEVQQRVEAFRDQATGWQTGFQQRGGQFIGPTPPHEAPHDWFTRAKPFFVVIGVIAGVFAVGYLVNAAAKFRVQRKAAA